MRTRQIRMAAMSSKHALRRRLQHRDFVAMKGASLQNGMPYHGVLIREYAGEIWENFDKFQVVPSSMKVFPTNFNGPLLPTVSRPREMRCAEPQTTSLTDNDPFLFEICFRVFVLCKQRKFSWVIFKDCKVITYIISLALYACLAV